MSDERIQLDTDGELDECVALGSYSHIERLEDNHWFVCQRRKDGSHVAVWLHGEVVDGNVVVRPSYEVRT